jgi:hypothetical protein
MSGYIVDRATIEDAKSLWGLNTYGTQDTIVSMVTGRTRFGEEWYQVEDAYTTARPQIVCIGPGHHTWPLAESPYTKKENGAGSRFSICTWMKKA